MGNTSSSAPSVAEEGTFMLNTMKVMMTANTPSLKASRRPLFIPILRLSATSDATAHFCAFSARGYAAGASSAIATFRLYVWGKSIHVSAAGQTCRHGPAGGLRRHPRDSDRFRGNHLLRYGCAACWSL